MKSINCGHRNDRSLRTSDCSQLEFGFGSVKGAVARNLTGSPDRRWPVGLDGRQPRKLSVSALPYPVHPTHFRRTNICTVGMTIPIFARYADAEACAIL
jgi:hypothetical protein